MLNIKLKLMKNPKNKIKHKSYSNKLKAFLKRNVLSCYLKIPRLLLVLTVNGSEFHKTGAAYSYYGDSPVLHCAFLMRTIFASLERANELARVQSVQNVRGFSRTKLDNEINARFLLNEHGDPHFLSQIQ